VVIIRHAFRDSTGKLSMVDSLYGHLHERKVKLYEVVKRGQLIGTMGGNNGMYAVHLHFEMRKNLRIGMQRSSYSRGFENYYRPTDFINSHRTCTSGLGRVEVPVDSYNQGNSAPAVELPTSTRSTYRTASGGLSIPVYKGGATISSSYKPGQPSVTFNRPSSLSQKTIEQRSGIVSPSTQGTTPGATSATGDSFWTRLKSKIQAGELRGQDPLAKPGS
jgi:hypothetical protein